MEGGNQVARLLGEKKDWFVGWSGTGVHGW